jgi:hypothetical protein
VWGGGLEFFLSITDIGETIEGDTMKIDTEIACKEIFPQALILKYILPCCEASSRQIIITMLFYRLTVPAPNRAWERCGLKKGIQFIKKR